MPEETIEEGAGGEITVTTALEEKPEVTPSGNVGQPTEAEMRAYAKSLLADEYDLVPKGRQSNAGTIKGTDIPLDMYSQEEWDDFTDSEKKIAARSWAAVKKSVAASNSTAEQLSAPALKAAAIAELSEGLTPKEVQGLKKAIKEEEDASNMIFAPKVVTSAMKKHWHRVAKGTVSELPPDAPKLKGEPEADGKIELTEEEMAVFEDQKRMGITPDPAKIRKMFKTGFKTEGYVAHKEKVSA